MAILRSCLERIPLTLKRRKAETIPRGGGIFLLELAGAGHHHFRAARRTHLEKKSRTVMSRSSVISFPFDRRFRDSYFQVLTAIVLGVLLGHFYPELGEQMKPLGDAFIKTIKMIIAPIIFCTVVHGIASMQDMMKVGRVGIKALENIKLLEAGEIQLAFVTPGGRSKLGTDPASGRAASSSARCGPSSQCTTRRSSS